MSRSLLALVCFLAMAVGCWAADSITSPFQADLPVPDHNPIDTAVLAGLREHGLTFARPCSDEVFVRRVYLDLIGTIPEPAEVLDFLGSNERDKRARLVDGLFDRPEYADYWAMKWCDALRVKSEFPINLWPNAVQAYHQWLRTAIRDNRPVDQVARALLTSSGSNFRVPPVNFYRAVQSRDPAGLATAVALTFMGTRLESWPEARRAGLAAFFSRVAYKSTGEWKEEIVFLDPAATEPVSAIYPDGTPVSIPVGQDPRQVFADWLLKPGNPYFARNVANRLWAAIFGRGVVNPPDDLRPDNPPSNPELLACLEHELVAAKYDLRRVLRLILTSRTYQQSSIPQQESPHNEALFACYPVRRLDAEVLIDALCGLGGVGENYSSAVPEPFTFIPPYQRTIALADGSITSPFLEMFGRPARDTGLFTERNNEPTEAQRMYLLNSSQVRRQIEQSQRLQQLVRDNPHNPEAVVEGIYLLVLSRRPTAAEVESIQRYAQASGLLPKQAMDDLVWSLVNSKEFLYRH